MPIIRMIKAHKTMPAVRMIAARLLLKLSDVIFFATLARSDDSRNEGGKRGPPPRGLSAWCGEGGQHGAAARTSGPGSRSATRRCWAMEDGGNERSARSARQGHATAVGVAR